MGGRRGRREGQATSSAVAPPQGVLGVVAYIWRIIFGGVVLLPFGVIIKSLGMVAFGVGFIGAGLAFAYLVNIMTKYDP